MTGSPDRPLVLVIEDDLRYVRQLRADLELCDCTAVVAGTGAGGLDLCATETPDVVLLDLGLPDVDALTVLGRVRATCDAPVVAMTLAEDDDGISRARWRRARTITWRSRSTWISCWRGCGRCCGGRRARRRGRRLRSSRTVCMSTSRRRRWR